MTDLSRTIAPKSDQLNADDLIVGPMTIRVTRVDVNEGAQDQPVSVFFEGDSGKPYKPCKSMRRVLVSCWGRDKNEYPGRSMTLYRDEAVQFGGMKVGGIRISHLSHIDGPITLALTVTRASRKPYKVMPLATATPAPDLADEAARLAALEAEGMALEGEAKAKWWASVPTADKRAMKARAAAKEQPQ